MTTKKIGVFSPLRPLCVSRGLRMRFKTPSAHNRFTLMGAGGSLLHNIHHNKYKIFKVKHKLPDSSLRDKRDRR